jgi:RNA polymerase sigma-70 factor (ECF subfamily)
MLTGSGPTWEEGPGSARSAAGASQSARTSEDYAALDDETLVRLLVEQDVRALDTLYVRYSRPIFSLALKILGDREIVEEVVQEVFMRLWTRAGSFDPQRGKLLSWLLTIAHHRAVDELRRRRAQPEVDGLQEQLAASEEPQSDPSETYTQIENREVVQRALAQLPEAQRKPIEMAYYGGLTQVEISLKLQEPLGTIKTRMRLGMQKLKGLLAEDVGGQRAGGRRGRAGVEPA